MIALQFSKNTNRAVVSVGVLWRNRLNIKSRFHSQRIYELKKWPLDNGPTSFCLSNCNGIRRDFFKFLNIRSFLHHMYIKIIIS